MGVIKCDYCGLSSSDDSPGDNVEIVLGCDACRPAYEDDESGPPGVSSVGLHRLVSVQLTDVGMGIAEGEVGIEKPWRLEVDRLYCNLVSLMRVFGPYLYDGSPSVFCSEVRVEWGGDAS